MGVMLLSVMLICDDVILGGSWLQSYKDGISRGKFIRVK